MIDMALFREMLLLLILVTMLPPALSSISCLQCSSLYELDCANPVARWLFSLAQYRMLFILYHEWIVAYFRCVFIILLLSSFLIQCDLQPKIPLPLPRLLGVHQLPHCWRQVLFLKLIFWSSIWDPRPKIFYFSSLSNLQGHIGSKLQQAGGNYHIIIIISISQPIVWTNCPRSTMKMAAATGGKKRFLL